VHCSKHNFGPQSYDHDNCSDEVYDPQGQQSTAISKVQIQCNILINNHKATLKLYDGIVNLSNDYVSSPNFNKYARLKTKKSFIQSTERTYRVTHIWPKHSNVILHDGGEDTVTVYDAKSMIMDLLTSPKCMNTSNIAKGYDAFSGYVDKSEISNKWYGEVHTGGAWLPARDRFCITNDENSNDMTIGLIVFGDKSHTDLHGASSLTPIIFTLLLFNRVSCNSTNFFGDHWHTSQILVMGRIGLTRLIQGSKFKMSIQDCQ
jgi:hypothetical protein